MTEKGRLKEYLNQFHNFVIKGAMKEHPQIIDVHILANYPREREIWCVFIYHLETENEESRFEIWTNFWEDICKKREIFYSDFKKQDLGFITLYPLFISSKKFKELGENMTNISK